MNDKKISVEVNYTGHDPYAESFPGGVNIGAVKRKAMHAFELEPSAAENYVVQFGGVSLDEHTKLSELGTEPVTLVLLLKKPQEKGNV